MSRLVKLTQEGRLHSLVDYGVGYPYGSFHGLEAVHSAVEVSATVLSFPTYTQPLTQRRQQAAQKTSVLDRK